MENDIHYKRRYYDGSVVKSIYKALTPWLQIAGFLLMCSFIIGGKSSKFDAYGATLEQHDNRLKALESRSDTINQKLDDMIVFFGIPQHGDSQYVRSKP